MTVIVNNVTPVYGLWHITVCAGHVSQLSIILQWFIYPIETKHGFTSATLVLGSQL